MWKALACLVKGVQSADSDPLRDHRGREDFELLAKSYEIITRAATTVGTTTTAGWAAELVITTAKQFSAALQPGIFASLTEITTGFDYADGVPRIPTRAATPAINGSFVGEGSAIPVRRIGLSSVTLNPRKMAVLSEFTNELFRASLPNIEQVLRTEIERDTRIAVDTALVDATAGDSVRPPGLRAGLSGLTPNASAAALDKIILDLRTLYTAIAPSYRPILLCNPLQAITLQALITIDQAADIVPGIRVISSPAVASGMLLLLDADSFVYVMSAPTFELRKTGVVHEEDTNPQPLSAAGTPNTVSAPQRSVYQTDAQLLRLVWPLNWALTRTSGAAWMTGVTW